jgi:hypothetical protein
MTHVNTRNLNDLQGKTVVIPKGTRVHSMHPSKREYVLKRAQRVKVHHTLSGWSMSHHMMSERDFRRVEQREDMQDQLEAYKKVKFDYDFARELRKEDEISEAALRESMDAYHKFRFVFSSPSVRWPGTSGYWCESHTWIEEQV